MVTEYAYFTVRARTLLTLGRESIKDHVTAMLELVKNSYDADATRVEIEIRSSGEKDACRYIRVADDGVGMSRTELSENWLHIGYSEKRTQRVTKRSRRVTGEKGIGRLSADRLGSSLEVRTKSKRASAVGLSVEWAEFESDDADLNHVPVTIFDDPTVSLPRRSRGNHGTELLIRNLRNKWSREDLIELHNELAIFVPPQTAIPDFRIVLYSGYDEIDGTVKSSFDARAEIEVDISLNKSGAVKYKAFGRSKAGARRQLGKSEMRWEQLQQAPGKTNASKNNELILGPVRARLLFFPRKAETIRGSKFTLRDLREFLDRHGGIRIYRDNIRVRPYGASHLAEGDWLELGGRKVAEPAGPARQTFRISPNQLVGTVLVGRDSNPELADSSGREGLVRNEAFEQLRRFVLGGVVLLERFYHKSFEQSKLGTSRDTESPKRVAAEIKRVASTLRQVKKAAESGSQRSLDRSIGEIPALVEKLERVERSAEELASQTTVLRGLATVGIAGAVFGHETQTSLAQVSGSSKTAIRLLTAKPPRHEDAVDEIRTALEHAKRVAGWGRFALARVRKDKRTRRQIHIHSLAEEICKTLKPPFTSSNISLETKIRRVVGRTFAIDIESVLVNLLTNAYTACQQIRRARRVRVEVGPLRNHKENGVQLVVADSGPGVAHVYRDRIWDALFSTKVGKSNIGGGGTGLGLTIVQSIVDEHQGKRSVEKDSKLYGARFVIWIPLG